MKILRYIFLLTCEVVKTDWKVSTYVCLQKAVRMFVLDLMSLMRNVRRAIQLHDDLSQSTKSPAELLTGCFNGLKVCHVLLHSFSCSLPFFL